MKNNKLIIISSIIALIFIASIIAICIYNFNNTYSLNINPKSVSKIVYCTDTNTAPENRKYIDITDKQDIIDILKIYNGTTYKLWDHIPIGPSPNITIYNGNGCILVSLSSFNNFLFKNDKYYSNYDLSKAKQDDFNQKLLKIVNKYLKG